MKISIDFDETFTLAPELWSTIINLMLASGHEVYCVSFRNEEDMEEVRETVGAIIGPHNCFGTGGYGKQYYMNAKPKIQIDVWIDDQPDCVVRGAEYYWTIWDDSVSSMPGLRDVGDPSNDHCF